MKRAIARVAAVAVATGLLVIGCGKTDNDTSAKKLAAPSGYAGGCTDGLVLFTQRQFNPQEASVRDDPMTASTRSSLAANTPLAVVGWYDTGVKIYPNNPPRIRGEVWFYVPAIKGWVADAALRTVETSPGEPFTIEQAAPLLTECELYRK